MIEVICYVFLLSFFLVSVRVSWWRQDMNTLSFEWPFVRGIHRSPVDFPRKELVMWSLFLLLLLALKSRCTNSRYADDLRRRRAHVISNASSLLLFVSSLPILEASLIFFVFISLSHFDTFGFCQMLILIGHRLLFSVLSFFFLFTLFYASFFYVFMGRFSLSLRCECLVWAFRTDHMLSLSWWT